MNESADEPLQLHFQTFGQGPPLIILHGLFGSLENWSNLSNEFAKRFQVFAVDLRNHGRSPHGPEMNYAIMAKDVRAFVQRHHLHRVHLLGHSMGGKVAMEFALQYPELVDKLMVVDIAPRAYPPLHNSIFDALLSLDLASFANRKQMEDALAPAIPDLAVRQFLLKNVTRDSTGAFGWKMNLPAIHKNYHRLSEALPDNRKFEGYALFIRGEQSDYLREDDEGNVSALFPRAQFRTIRGAGHWVHAEAPLALLRTALEFLEV